MKNMIFIAARMGSTRLPGKTLIDLNGKPLLWYVVDKAKKTGLDFAILTPTEKKDDAIQEYCEENNLKCYRGSENDVFSRFKDAAIEFKADVIVRLTGDNPFVDSNIIKEMLELHILTNADLTSTRIIKNNKITDRSLPKGLSIDIFNSKPLIEATELTADDKEHIIPYFFNNDFNITFFDYDFSDKEANFSIDTKEDLEKAKKILSNLNWETFTINDLK